MARGEGKLVGREEQAQGKRCRVGRRCAGVPVDHWRRAAVLERDRRGRRGREDGGEEHWKMGRERGAPVDRLWVVWMEGNKRG
jgi:hypothetical protein